MKARILAKINSMRKISKIACRLVLMLVLVSAVVLMPQKFDAFAQRQSVESKSLRIDGARIDYQLAPAENEAILKGRIFRAESQAISSSGKVLVKLVCDSSPETKWTVSDNRGFFYFGNLQIGDFCTATPQRIGYHFFPAWRPIPRLSKRYPGH